ncbi:MULTISPECIES: IS1380 family transposase [unclassified Micromonospora]|uniref:IS1380 family transposase n=1 Tax=unclassified Micromonospora TaxID=2617518 RepID=UPI00362F9694
MNTTPRRSRTDIATLPFGNAARATTTVCSGIRTHDRGCIDTRTPHPAAADGRKHGHEQESSPRNRPHKTIPTACHEFGSRVDKTYKRTFGFHPLLVTCDNTGEMLAIQLRPGNAGANTAADHLHVLGEAFTQVPAAHRRHLLVRADSAGATHAVLDWLTAQNAKRGRTVEYSIGWSIGEPERQAITKVPASAWTPAINADGGVRDGAHVTELTGLLTLTGWPSGMRVIVRRERPHPGAQLTLFEERDGWRYTAFVTNTRAGALQWLEARHRAHARVEDRIRCAKDTGLRRLPSREFPINQAWCILAAIAADLIAWLQILTLTGDLARCEPKTLRYRLLHTAARLVHGQRRRRLRIPTTWPWADQITAAFTRIAAIPDPG